MNDHGDWPRALRSAGYAAVRPSPAVPVALGGRGTFRAGWTRDRLKRVGRWVLIIGALGAAVLVMRGRVPNPSDIWAAIRSANPAWFGAAIVAEAASMAMFARQQRQLLRVFGVSLSMRRALAITYSRSAITVAVPAGSAVSAGFAFQQYRAKGASKSAAASVTVLSGLASTVGLFILYLGGLVVAAVPSIVDRWQQHPAALSVTAGLSLLTAASGLTLVGLLIGSAMRGRPARELRIRPDESTVDGFFGRAWDSVVRALRAAREVPRRHWAAVLGLAAANWLGDLLCLLAVSRALHLSLPLGTMASAYLAIQLVRQIPLTPGGIGLVETSLLTALVSAGAGHAAAAAVVLGYRLLSCWVILPIGLLTWIGLRHATPDPGEGDAAAEDPRPDLVTAA